jgi:hypothetical protein
VFILIIKKFQNHHLDYYLCDLLKDQLKITYENKTKFTFNIHYHGLNTVGSIDCVSFINLKISFCTNNSVYVSIIHNLIPY